MKKITPVILLAEDSPDDQFFFRREWNRLGSEIPIVAVSDGQAVIEYLNGENLYADRTAHPMPTMVILDLNLPKMNGLAVLRQMRMRPEWEGIAVVILSGSLNSNIEQEAKEMGAVTMEKPARAEQLRSLAAWLQQ